MAKSKNSSQANVSKKNHRNGIKMPKSHRYPSLNGVCAKFLRNQRYAKLGSKEAALKKKMEA